MAGENFNKDYRLMIMNPNQMSGSHIQKLRKFGKMAGMKIYGA